MSVVVRDVRTSAVHSSAFEYELASLCVTNRSAMNVYCSRCRKRGDADATTTPGTSWKKKSLSRAGPVVVFSSGALRMLSVQPAVAVVVAWTDALARAGDGVAASASANMVVRRNSDAR